MRNNFSTNNRMNRNRNEKNNDKKKVKILRKRACKFCGDSTAIDYKDQNLLRSFITERGKIIPSRISGNCAKHQRKVTNAVKRARTVALLPFTIVTSGTN